VQRYLGSSEKYMFQCLPVNVYLEQSMSQDTMDQAREILRNYARVSVIII